MTTYVLVPGAWLGSWCWKKVTPHLHAKKQHQVYTLTLTGLGERVHLATPDVNLDTHIQDVINVLIYEDLWNVVLLGHSYSGMVVTGVANQVPERLSHLVYLDAIVPRNGQSLIDDWSAAGWAAVKEEARLKDEGWRWPIPDDLHTMSSLAGLTHSDKEWLYRQATPQPLKTFSQPLRLVTVQTPCLNHVIPACL